jgi:hypothetical protein
MAECDRLVVDKEAAFREIVVEEELSTDTPRAIGQSALFFGAYCERRPKFAHS